MHPRRALPLLAFLLLAAPALAPGGTVGDTTLFANVPAPGFPEGIVVDAARGLVFVGGPAEFTFGKFPGPATVHAFDLTTGALVRSFTFALGDPEGPQALSNLALDGQGRVYVLHNQPGLGVIRFDPATGIAEPYAPIPDLKPCLLNPDDGPCSPTLTDRMALPNDLVFTADGTLYVTDSWQATIWRVPPGGGSAQVWFQHPGLDEPFGPNGLALNADRTGFFLAKTFELQHPELPAGIYTLPLVDAPAPKDLQLWKSIDGGPDGIVLGASGLLWLVLAFDNQVVGLEPDGGEAARFPEPLANALSPHPYDAPATAAFADGRRSLLVTNHALFDGYAVPERFDVLEAFVDDVALPVEKPLVP